MASIAHLFTTTETVAKLNDGFENCDTSTHKFVFYKLQDTHLTGLYGVLTGANNINFCDIIAEDADSSEMTFEIPDEYTKAFSKVEDSEISRISQDWLKIEDHPYSDTVELQELITALQRLARIALSQDNKLYMWFSL